MSVSTLAAFLAVDLLLVLIPGADWTYVITAGLAGARVAPAAGGLVIGYAADTALVAAGLGLVVARTPGLLTGLTVLGAVYLLWLGAGTLARPLSSPGPPARAANAEVPAPSPWRALARGAGVSGLNPKGLLLYLALLPQFTHPGTSWPVAAQLALLGVLHMADCAIVYVTVGTLARTLLRTRASAARMIARLSGIAMIAVAVSLLVERLVR